MKLIKEAGDIRGKRVLVRVDWSVPMEGGEIKNDYQIKVSLPTLEYLKSQGAHIIVATHLESTAQSVEPLKVFVPEGVEILSNLRENPGEKSNSEEFAKELASKADIFVNEAFAVSHREHASVVGVPKLLPSFAGLRLEDEIESLSKAFDPPHPFLFILGGAKFETKLPLVEKFLDIADEIIIAGANAVPASKTSIINNPKISLPLGDTAALDADEENIENYKSKINNAEFILWNGPLGDYEEGYKKGTLGLAKILADSGNQVIVGGGDTLTAINELDIFDKFTFVSTGGGAMLDFLANGTLPGIEVLK